MLVYFIILILGSHVSLFKYYMNMLIYFSIM